ncbi:MAG: hypothetical protein HC836_38435 [Richelia sp. RM2_1_2]|nr:hypothetical protein [Richelia sp. RM2_1_2]
MATQLKYFAVEVENLKKDEYIKSEKPSGTTFWRREVEGTNVVTRFIRAAEFAKEEGLIIGFKSVEPIEVEPWA